MKYNPILFDDEILGYDIRNDAGMSIGRSHANLNPFEGCEPVTLEDAKANARLWAAAPDLLEVLLEVNNRYASLMTEKMRNKMRSAINKARGL